MPTHARGLAARLSALLTQDVAIIERLYDAQRRLMNANERLWSGLAPAAFGLVYDSADAATIGTSEVACVYARRPARLQRARPRGPAERPLARASRVHRLPGRLRGATPRRLAIEVSELSRQLTDALLARPAGAHWRPRTPTSTNSPEWLPERRKRPRAATGAGVIEGTLRAYYCQLRLSVEDHEFPHFNTGRDGNALACQVVVEDTEIGDSYLRHSPTLYNFELASFTEESPALEVRKPPDRPSSATPTRNPATKLGQTSPPPSDGTGTLAGFVGNKAGARLGFGPIDMAN